MFLAKIEFAFCTTNSTSKLSNLCCFYAFYAVYIECSFLTNFCWRGRCEFEAWLNFTRVASRSLFLELLIEILLKELVWWQMITRRGSASKFLPWMFLLDYIELFLSIRGCLVIRSFLADAFLATLVIFS